MILLYTRTILSILILYCFPTFSQKCNTFQSVNYQFGFSENKQDDSKTPIVTLKKISQNQKPIPPVNTTNQWELLDAHGFLPAYIMAMGFIQHVQQNPKSSKKTRSKMTNFIKTQLTNFHQKIKSLQKDLSQDLKPKDPLIKNIVSIIQETEAFLNHTEQDIQKLNSYFEKMKNLFTSIRLFSYSNDVQEKASPFIPPKVLMRTSKENAWTKKELFTESQILPPFSLLGQRATPFLCHREAVSITSSVDVSRRFLK